MFLIDSSAWIEYLRPGGMKKARERISEILQQELALSCGVVAIEVLRGAKNEKDFRSLKESLLALPQIAIDSDVIERAAEWGFLLDRKGKIVSTTDLLIASAAYDKATLLHLDSDFELIASVFELKQERLRV